MRFTMRYAPFYRVFVSPEADARNSLPSSLLWTSQPTDLVSCLQSAIFHGFLSPTPSRRDTSPLNTLNLDELELRSSLSSHSLATGSSGAQTGRRMTSGTGATRRVGFASRRVASLCLISVPQISLIWKLSGEPSSSPQVGGEDRGTQTICSCFRSLLAWVFC